MGGVSPGVSDKREATKTLKTEVMKAYSEGNRMRVWQLKEYVAPRFVIVCEFYLFLMDILS